MLGLNAEQVSHHLNRKLSTLEAYFVETDFCPNHPNFFFPLRHFLYELWKSPTLKEKFGQRLAIAYRKFIIGQGVAHIILWYDLLRCPFLILSWRDLLYLTRKSFPEITSRRFKLIYLYLLSAWLKLELVVRGLNSQELLLIADFGGYGGTRTYLNYLLKWARSHHYNVTLLTHGELSTDDHRQLLDRGVKKIIIESSTPAKFIAYQRSRVLQLQRQYRFAKLVVSTGDPTGFAIGYWIGFYGKSILVLHTSPSCPILPKLRRYTIQSLSNKGKKIIGVSQNNLQRIKSFWLDGEDTPNLLCLYNPYIPKSEPADCSSASPKIVLTVGHVVSYKNPFFWIEVAKSVNRYYPDVSFIWLGDGELFEKCRSLVKEYSFIEFLGYRSDVEAFYQTAHVYVQPSLWESLGISVLGASYFGLPCVVSNSGGLPETTISKKTGYILDLEVSLFSDAILHLLNNDLKRKQMGLAARQLFDKRFSYARWESKLVRLL